ncbi:MAG: transporter, partial [Acidocella sp.]|nr:transporter [Acidocella sp.]
GFTGLLPIIDLTAHFDATSPVALKANGFGVGDLTFGPFLQLPPIMGAAGPVFSERVELDIVAPIGDYNRHADINQSSGFWSINPYWAFTVLPAPGFEISSRLHYLYNFTNDHPAGSGPAFTIPRNFQAGAAIWDNFAASYTVAPGLDLGINGYYFQQINQDKINGVTQSNSETTNVSIGPGLTYAVNKTNFLFANAYLPVVEKNTTDGFHTVFRWVHIF